MATATVHSSLYGTPPNAAAGTAPIYRGPSGAMGAGSMHTVRGTVTLASAFGASAVADLCDVPSGAKLLRIVILPSADLNAGNDFTFNLGWASAATAHASASTGLQAATAYSATAADLIASAAAADGGDKLQLARVAGSLAAGSLSFVAEFG